MRLGVVDSELTLVSSHGLAGSDPLIVEAIIETGQRYETDRRGQSWSKMR